MGTSVCGTTKAPQGWYCTRTTSHDGPCAAVPLRELSVVKQVDGHWCNDWDGLAVSAWTYEYDCCTDFKKSRLGRVINRLMIIRFNFEWWMAIGRHKPDDPEIFCETPEIKSETDLTNQ